MKKNSKYNILTEYNNKLHKQLLISIAYMVRVALHMRSLLIRILGLVRLTQTHFIQKIQIKCKAYLRIDKVAKVHQV